jgi:hypothetical protein
VIYVEGLDRTPPKKLLNLVRERVDKCCESISPAYSEAAKVTLSIVNVLDSLVFVVFLNYQVLL